NYGDQEGNATVSIGQAASTTVVTCPATPLTYTGSAITPCSVSVTGANLSLSPDPDYANNINAGTDTASAIYTYPGDPNHTGSSDSKHFTINKAAANITVTGFSGVYDGNPHGVVSSSATGVNSQPLSGLVVDPTTYTNVPGGPVHWLFTNANYGDRN